MKILDREILLKSLVGSHNYNLNNEDSDKDYKVFVAPKFEELYNGKRFAKQILGDKEDITIHDIRKLTELLFKSNINFLEVLASKEVYIADNNPEIHRIFELKKDIFKMNLPYLHDSCQGMYFNKMKLLNKGTQGTQHLVDKFGYDLKQATHAYRCLKFAEDFAKTDFEDFEGSIKYDGEDLEFMLEIRHGFFKQNVFENFIKHYYESTFRHVGKRYHGQPVDLELKEELEGLVMSLIKRKIREED